MSEKEILEKVIEMFADMTEEEGEVTADSEILEDLGINSMDLLTLITGLEEEFSIRIPEKLIRKLNTVGDVAEMVRELIG